MPSETALVRSPSRRQQATARAVAARGGRTWAEAENPVVLWARVSTRKQATDRQVSDLTAFAARNAYQVVATVTEVMSGAKKTKDRPAFQQVLALARAGQVRKVLVTEITRIGRDTKEVLTAVQELTDLGVGIHIESSGLETLLPDGRPNSLALTMLTFGAEFGRLEREWLTDRIYSGLDEAEAKGVKLGRPTKDVATMSEADRRADEDKLLARYGSAVRELCAGESVRRVVKLAVVSEGTVKALRRILVGRGLVAARAATTTPQL